MSDSLRSIASEAKHDYALSQIVRGDGVVEGGTCSAKCVSCRLLALLYAVEKCGLVKKWRETGELWKKGGIAAGEIYLACADEFTTWLAATVQFRYGPALDPETDEPVDIPRIQAEARLEELKHWGKHRHLCAIHLAEGMKCSCGFDERIAALEKAAQARPEGQNGL